MSYADLPAPLNHHQLGRVQGRYGKGVIQYLGLKYASLDHRFAEAKLVAYDGLSKIDATRHGLESCPPKLRLLFRLKG
jgi:hypothetical protein